MADNIKATWLKDKNGVKVAPKTFVKQVISEIGESLQDILDRKITIPTSASVGQLLSVKAIDENGKPTEWETISIEDIANQVKAIL